MAHLRLPQCTRRQRSSLVLPVPGMQQLRLDCACAVAGKAVGSVKLVALEASNREPRLTTMVMSGRSGDVCSECDLESLCKAGRVAEVMDVLEEGGMSGCSKKLYAQLMCRCGQMRALVQAKRIHAHLVEKGWESDWYLGGGIVEMYVKCGSVVDAHRVHHKLPHPNEFSWTALICGYANSGQCERAVSVYEEMRHERVTASTYTFVQALKACASLGSLDSGRKIHAHMIESGKEWDVFVATALLDMYGKCGSMVDAQLVFHRLPRRDVVSWTAIILAYAEKQEGEMALQLYAQMQREGVAPNARTFVGALKACSSLAAVEEEVEVDGVCVKMACLEKGRSIHSHVRKAGWESDLFVGNTLMDMYAKCGSMLDARQVFDRLPRRDVVSWNVAILGYAELAESEHVFALYARMQEAGVVADRVTFLSVLKACGNTAALETGKRVHLDVCRAGLEAADLMVATALVDMYAKCGSMADAQHLFDRVASRDLVAWTALIAGYARQGQSETVFSLFERMKQEGIRPDGVAFLSVLTVCTHVGLVDMGKDFFKAMSQKYGLAPTIEHYNCMVDLLGRAGLVDEAVALVQEMPFKANLVTWMIMLGACRKWTRLQVARHAFESAVELDEKHPVAYVLMSNVYADAHMWEDRDKIRARKQQAGARKEPGKSWWTDTGGLVHTFCAGDTKHPQSTEMSAKLRQLYVKMEEEGYAPNLHCVLWDITDDEKEDALCGHSEKLAIVCALINTPPGTAIRIVKNLRVCDDCHKATALISKIEKRTIICRDATRFHVYMDGKCSCGDYW